MAASPVTLRAYRQSDFEALVTIDQACFTPGIAYGRREMRAYLTAEGAWCTVAESGGEIAGFILSESETSIAHIITLDVSAAFRRRSVGSALLGDFERQARARGATLLYLETATTNKPAIALWKKHGYCETGIIKNYYGRGQHAFQMEKLLRRAPEDA